MADCFNTLEENLRGWEAHGNDLLLKKDVVSLRADPADGSTSTESRKNRRVSEAIS